jgi:hypothetical protein
VIKYVLWFGGLCYFAAATSAGSVSRASWMGAVAGALAMMGLAIGLFEIASSEDE